MIPHCTVAVRRIGDALRRLGEGVDIPLGPIVSALQASVSIVTRNRALTRAATHCRRFAPGFFAARSEHRSSDLFRASLEEAAVSRPGRKAGIEDGHHPEHRRCGTGAAITHQ